MEPIELLINEIESEILKAKKAPFSASDIIVNKMTMLDLISRFRASYPLVIKEANQITKERDEIFKKAEKYANDTMDAAEDKARALISETEIMKQAAADAEAMRAEAEEGYKKTDYEARSVAFNLLDKIERTMKESLAVISDSKRKLIE